MSPTQHLQPKRRSIAEINVVPYIDVMLVLLVVFMVTAPLLTQGIAVELPDVLAEPLAAQDSPVVVSIDREGRYYINVGQDPTQFESLSLVLASVEKILIAAPSTLIMVEADTRVFYGKVMQLISGLQQLGASNVGFVTDPSPDHGTSLDEVSASGDA